MRINNDLIKSYIKNEYNNTLNNTFSANYINQRIYNIGAEYGSTGTIKNFKGTTAGSTGYIQKQIECPAGICIAFATYQICYAQNKIYTRYKGSSGWTT